MSRECQKQPINDGAHPYTTFGMASKPKHSHDLDETYKYVRHGSDEEMKRLLRELWIALRDLEYKP